jgi:hypothetical protein
MKPKLYVLGGSHAIHLSRELQKRTELTSKYDLKVFAKGGALYRNLIFPKVSAVHPDDFIIIIPLGNDLLKKGSVEKTDGIFHLVKYMPLEDPVYTKYCQDLLEKTRAYPCKILVITSFYRLFCCETHKHPGWLKLQVARNKELTQTFEGEERVKVLDHRSIIDRRAGKRLASKNIPYYISLQRDAVHFKSYVPMAEKVHAAFF